MSFEDIKDKSLLSSRAQELLRNRQERLKTPSVGERRTIEKIMQDQAEIDKIIADVNRAHDDKIKEITAISARQNELRKMAEEMARGRQYSTNKQFQTQMQTALGSRQTNQDISRMTSSAAILGSAISMAQGSSTQDLEQVIQTGRSRVDRQSTRLLSTSGNIDDNEAQFGIQLGVRQKEMQKIAQAQAALQAQRKMGLDTASQYYGAQETTQQVQRDRMQQQIRDDVSSGRAGSKSQVQEELNSIGEKLIATFEKLDEAVKSNAKEAGDLNKAFKEIEEDYNRKKQTLDEMNRGGGGRSTFSGIAGNLGNIVGAGTDIYRYAGVTSEMQQMGNRAGYAAQSNQRFTDAYGATQGDMMALRRTLTNQAGREARFGREMGGRESIASVGDVTASGLRAVGAGEDALTSVGGLANSAINTVKGAVLGTGGSPGGMALGAAGGAAVNAIGAGAPEFAQGINQGIGAYKGISADQTALGAAGQYRNLNTVVNQISDMNSQKARDFLYSMSTSTRGLGGGGAGGARGFGGSGAMGTEVDSMLGTSDEFVNKYTNKILDSTEGRTGMKSQRLSAMDFNQNLTPGVSGNIRGGQGRRENVMSDFMDPSKLAGLQGATGLSQSEIASLTASGVGGMGSAFGGMSDVKRAGELARGGQLQDPSQYMSMRGQLADVGGKGSDFESILRNAVANGMDNSKNIQQMVEATSSLAARSAGLGAGTAGGASEMMGKGIDSLTSLGVDANMAAGASANAANFINKQTTDEGLNIGNVTKMSRLQAKFPKAAPWQLRAMSNMSGDQMEQYKKTFESGTKAEQDEFGIKMGIEPGLINSAEDVGNLQGIQREATLLKSGIGLGGDLDTDKDVMSGNMTPKARARMNAALRPEGASGDAVMAQLDPNGRARQQNAQTAVGGYTAAGEDQRVAAGTADAKMFAAGVDNFTKAIGDFKAIGEVMKQVAERLDPSAMAQDAGNAAGQRGFQSGTFDRQVVAFNNAIEAVVDGLGKLAGKLGSGGGTNPSSMPSNNVNPSQSRFPAGPKY